MVALMRGINVGKSKRITMADLRELLTGLGYTEVRTHLNSGNVVFNCTARQSGGAAKRIERAITDDLGVECAVMVRSGAEIIEAVAANPLAGQGRDPAKLLVGFLSEKPDCTRADALNQRDFGQDEVRLIGREVYLWCPVGVLNSPFSKLAWDREIGTSVTMRNWNTTRKLAELVETTDR